MSPIDRKREIREHIQANLNRPYDPTVLVPIPLPSFGRHEKAWTQETANRDWALLESRRKGKHSRDVSPTHKPAYPFTEQQWLGNVAA